MEKFSLPSIVQLKGDDRHRGLDIIEMIGINSFPTDFYFALENISGFIRENCNGRYSTYLLKDSVNKIYLRTVDENGTFDYVYIHDENSGIRPIFNFSKKLGIPTNNGQFKVINDHTIEVEYGYFPQTLVSEDIISNATKSGKLYAVKTNAHEFEYYGRHLLAVYTINNEMFIKYIAKYDVDPYYNYLEREEVFKLEPVKWFVDLKENVMLSEKTLSYGERIASFEQSKYNDKHFDKTSMSEYLNNSFAHSLKMLIEKEHRLDIKEVKRKIENNEVERISIEELKKQLTNQSNILKKEKNPNKRLSSKENSSIDQMQTSTPNTSNLNNVQKTSGLTSIEKKDEVPKNYSFNNQIVTMSGKFIQVMFNNQIYSLPLDNYISSDIRMQDDVNFVYDFNNNIVRNDKTEEETFKINNALRIAYLKRLNKIPLSEELKEYIKRHDKNIEYKDLSSVTTIKTIVNELAYIYYKEYTSKQLNKNNENVFHTRPNGVNLDKGFDDEYYNDIKLGRSK